VGNRAQRAGDGQPQVDLLIQVSEGKRFRTGMISVVGNTITRDRVIRRQLTLQPGRPLDATAAKESEQRVANTRLFAPGSVKVALQPEDPQNAPGERDVVVEVGETNTGSFNIGVSAGSDGGVAGLISLSQRNFDITDTPDSLGEFFSSDSFRGGGQTLTFLVSPGDRVRNFELGLSDPALNDSEYSGSAKIFYRQRIYGAYDENRYGARFSVGRRFGSLWSLNVPIKIENVDLSDLDADAPKEYFDVADSRLINSVGLSLTRSSLDRLAFPTKGTRIEFGFEQYGFLGDEAFTRLNAEWSRYFLLEQDVVGRSTTLQLSARANYILGGEDVAPFYERNFLGGQNFRGFAFRRAGPVGFRNDNGQRGDDPVGGNWLFFAGAELTRPLIEESVAGAVFIDTGTVERELGFSEYRASVGVGIRLLIPQLGNAPLAFDFAIPVMKQDFDKSRLFTFTLDVPFN
jgi:outer membrane protein insertion porin family